MSALLPLRHKPFRYLVAGRFITMLGNALAPIALAFAVLDLTGSVNDLGLVVGARSLMNVMFLLFGGVIADRLPRHLVMVASSVLAALTQAAVATLILTGSASIGLLAALAAVNGAASAFAFPAGAAIMAQTVPQELLQSANSLNRLGINTAMIVGASAGGVLVATVGPGWGLAFDAATFLLAALAFAGIRVPRVSSRAPVARSAFSAFTDLRDGWREFTAHTWLWVVVLGFAVLNMIRAASLSVLGPAIADETFGRQGWGLVLAVQTGGMVAGTLVALAIRSRRLLRFGIMCILGELPIMFALAKVPFLLVLLPLAMLAGVATVQFSIAWETTMQRYIPADKLARVYSYDMLGSIMVIP
ncbi:MAG: MFS transporter, partial [Dehalococcoidia bacterium]